MLEEKPKTLIASFKLNIKQSQAALERERDVVVTAGAGSGKTLTLVARYVSLLAEGIQPRRIAAITFTKKAAREMRSRVRVKLMELQQIEDDEQQRRLWIDLSAQIDSARIGTIHSLCSEILRLHPAEAGIDPRFNVIDERLSAALRIQAVDDTIKTLVEDEKFIPLLFNIDTSHLTELLEQLLNNRLEAETNLPNSLNQQAILFRELANRINHPQILDLIHDLRSMPEQELRKDAGDGLANMVGELIHYWDTARDALKNKLTTECATALYQIRRSKMNGRLGKRDSIVKGMVAELRVYFEKIIIPLTGGNKSTDPVPSQDSESLMVELLPLLQAAFNSVVMTYQDMLEARQALDFDDLEGRALTLLKQDEIKTYWRNELDALLVDEFQDTNQRQREIVEALTDKPGKLFIVGDMRQSIYRFRQADVTVFHDVQERIREENGLLVDLDLTYRAHQPLLDGLGDILSEVIGTDPDPVRPYYVPYTPMVANQKQPPKNILAPHIEFIFGAGEDAAAAKPLAARVLAHRLLLLKSEGQIEKWDDVALLFRASTGFPDYEEAFQEAGIPFVTVAGRGFYDRPEIRDLLNILRALADPHDDLAFAGLLRSPAFGLSDAALFLLLKNGKSYWKALQDDLTYLDEKDQQNAQRSRTIIESILPLVNRIPVAELLKHVVDALDYRAILATADSRIDRQDAAATGGRLYRNLDKLQEDALASQQVSLLNYLDMLKTLNDAGAREGEAPAEAQGAVGLMTIHKSKGLEFNIVVLASASRNTRSSSEWAYFSKDLGVTLKLDTPPMLYNLAKFNEKDKDEMEQLRLLYVALTRAKRKIIISGHTNPNRKGNLTFNAWAGKLVKPIELDSYLCQEADSEPFECRTASGQPVYVWCAQAIPPYRMDDQLLSKKVPMMDDDKIPVYPPIEGDKDEITQEKFDKNSCRLNWQETRIPGDILGTLVHKALQHWLFPDDPHLSSFLETSAINEGLVSDDLRSKTIQKAINLLNRFRNHQLWELINGAQERYHELPFMKVVNDKSQMGIIDLLYRDQNGWHIIDFKSDPVDTFTRKEELITEYSPQLIRYHDEVRDLLDVTATTSICFLDDFGELSLVEVSQVN